MAWAVVSVCVKERIANSPGTEARVNRDDAPYDSPDLMRSSVLRMEVKRPPYSVFTRSSAGRPL